MNTPIKPPEIGAKQPDSATKKNPDYTGNDAPDRVFHINLGIFRYGTSDKSHGAAVLLSLLLFFCILVLSLAGFAITDESKIIWLNRIFDWMAAAFLFVTGVAVGRNPASNDD